MIFHLIGSKLEGSPAEMVIFVQMLTKQLNNPQSFFPDIDSILKNIKPSEPPSEKPSSV